MRRILSCGWVCVLCALRPVLGVPQAGLQAWYPFDGHVQDASGNGRHGTVHNALDYAPGVHGQAGLFNGSSSWVGVVIPLAAGDWTICGWAWVDEIDPAYTDWQNFVSSWSNSFAVGVANQSGGRLTLWIGGATAQAQAPIPLHQPVFWLVEHEASTYRLWQNGSLAGTASGSFTPPQLEVLGQWRTDAASPFDREPFDGWLDDLCVYNRVLSAEEKAALLDPCSQVEAVLDLRIQAADPDALLNWTPVPGAGQYQVWAASGLDASWSLLATTSATSWTDQGAVPQGLRCYRVVAVCP